MPAPVFVRATGTDGRDDALGRGEPRLGGFLRGSECIRVGVSHLSFSVARLISEKMSATIQNRMTTFVSFHPDSSKW